jgi:hypothetical protein
MVGHLRLRGQPTGIISVVFNLGGVAASYARHRVGIKTLYFIVAIILLFNKHSAISF